MTDRIPDIAGETFDDPVAGLSGREAIRDALGRLRPEADRETGLSP